VDFDGSFVVKGETTKTNSSAIAAAVYTGAQIEINQRRVTVQAVYNGNPGQLGLGIGFPTPPINDIIRDSYAMIWLDADQVRYTNLYQNVTGFFRLERHLPVNETFAFSAFVVETTARIFVRIETMTYRDVYDLSVLEQLPDMAEQSALLLQGTGFGISEYCVQGTCRILGNGSLMLD